LCAGRSPDGLFQIFGPMLHVAGPPHALRPFLRSPPTKLIEENWDDMLQLAGSFKLGMVQAVSIMKTLRIDDRPTKLAQAVAELGHIDKTIHALTYIADENKRRRTLNQLNRGED